MLLEFIPFSWLPCGVDRAEAGMFAGVVPSGDRLHHVSFWQSLQIST